MGCAQGDRLLLEVSLELLQALALSEDLLVHRHDRVHQRVILIPVRPVIIIWRHDLGQRRVVVHSDRGVEHWRFCVFAALRVQA